MKRSRRCSNWPEPTWAPTDRSDYLGRVIRASTAQLLFASQLLLHLTQIFTDWLGQPQLMQPFTLWNVIRLVVMSVSTLQGFCLPKWTE
jgi:hypothetical protein